MSRQSFHRPSSAALTSSGLGPKVSAYYQRSHSEHTSNKEREGLLTFSIADRPLSAFLLLRAVSMSNGDMVIAASKHQHIWVYVVLILVFNTPNADSVNSGS